MLTILEGEIEFTFRGEKHWPGPEQPRTSPHTVIPMFLTSPNRSRAVLAQLIAVLMSGALLILLGQGLVIAEVALTLPSTGYDFLVKA